MHGRQKLHSGRKPGQAADLINLIQPYIMFAPEQPLVLRPGLGPQLPPAFQSAQLSCSQWWAFKHANANTSLMQAAAHATSNMGSMLLPSMEAAIRACAANPKRYSGTRGLMAPMFNTWQHYTIGHMVCCT